MNTPETSSVCCACGTSEHGGRTFYENYQGKLFCWPCADGEDPAAPAPAAPVAFLKGTFALYDTPAGGIHLAFRLDGEDADRHHELPAGMAAMLRQAAAGETGGKTPGMLGMLKGLRAMKGAAL
jgi:hypothetical protein